MDVVPGRDHEPEDAVSILAMDDGGAFELDASGRIVAEAQPVIAPRPAGPWDGNAAPSMRVVCCWCVPAHVISDGIEPVSHGMCAEAVERFAQETA